MCAYCVQSTVTSSLLWDAAALLFGLIRAPYNLCNTLQIHLRNCLRNHHVSHCPLEYTSSKSMAASQAWQSLKMSWSLHPFLYQFEIEIRISSVERPHSYGRNPIAVIQKTFCGVPAHEIEYAYRFLYSIIKSVKMITHCPWNTATTDQNTEHFLDLRMKFPNAYSNTFWRHMLCFEASTMFVIQIFSTYKCLSFILLVAHMLQCLELWEKMSIAVL